MDDTSLLHIGQRLHTPVGVRGKSATEICAPLRAQFIDHQYRVHSRMAHTCDAPDGDAVAIPGGMGSAYLRDSPLFHGISLPCKVNAPIMPRKNGKNIAK
jgi:hypothetical protein